MCSEVSWFQKFVLLYSSEMLIISEKMNIHEPELEYEMTLKKVFETEPVFCEVPKWIIISRVLLEDVFTSLVFTSLLLLDGFDFLEPRKKITSHEIDALHHNVVNEPPFMCLLCY